MRVVRTKTNGDENEKTNFGDSLCGSRNHSFRRRYEREPVMEAPVVASTMDQAAGSASTLLIPLALIAIVALATN